MNDYNYSMNEDIHKKKSFKNPSIYEKFIEAYGLDEFGSSFPNVSHLIFELHESSNPINFNLKLKACRGFERCWLYVL